MTTKGFLIFIGILVLLFGVVGFGNLLERSQANASLISEASPPTYIVQLQQVPTKACPPRNFVKEYITVYSTFSGIGDSERDAGKLIGLGLVYIAEAMIYCK
jgi:hypothetical protein